MRRSTMVSLTVLPMLATAAVATAEPPERATFSPPGMTQPMQEPELSPPGLTPNIYELDCHEDPNWRLRPDCPRQISYGGQVIRGGFGNYFHLGSGPSGGSGGSSGGSRASGGG